MMHPKTLFNPGSMMSMLNQSGEEQVECPLCMEALEVDDLNFFPCTCGYQICRFCWHRIRTDENGLCPACRKAYPENPADFKPLTQEEVAKLKAEKRHKDQQRKQKITENRKHLANVRVVQRNLVFVVGLPMRLADPEVLKKHEYFGKFGKIHKVVINQSTTYAGSQGPSASAYVTYHKADDALRAIQAVNNIVVDGRTIKTSLGTTKYCSHFMKNQTCPKPDCMYLHDLGDVEASFTKEEMQQGKHQEYERKLHELLLNNYNQGNKDSCSSNTSNQSYSKEAWPSLQPGAAPPRTKSGSSTSTSSNASNSSNVSTNSSNGCGNGNQNGCSANSACYTHHGNSRIERRQKSDQVCSNVSSKGSGPNHKKRHGLEDHKGKGKEKSYNMPQDENSSKMSSHCKTSHSNNRANSKTGKEGSHSLHNVSTLSRCPHPSSDVDAVLEETLDGGLRGDCDLRATCESKVSGSDEDSESSSKGGSSGGRTLPTTHRTAALFEPDNNSFFSTNSFTKVSASAAGSAGSDWPLNSLTLTHIPDVLPPVHSSEDWQAAFGFSNTGISIPPRQSESPFPHGVTEKPSLNTEYNGGKSPENCDTVCYDTQNGQAIQSQGFNGLSSSSSAENISLSGVRSSQEEYGLTKVGNLTEKLNELLLEGVNCTEVKEMASCPAGNCEMSPENVRLHITASCENTRVLPDGQNHTYHNVPSPASSDDPSIFMVNKPCPVQSSNHVPNGIQSLQAAKFLSEFHVKHNNVSSINKVPANMCVHPLMETEALSGHNGEGNASTVVVSANSHANSGEGPNLLCLLKSGHNISRFSSSANGNNNDCAVVSKCANEKYPNSDIFKRQIGCESASEIIVYNMENEISVQDNVAENSKENQRVPDDDLGFDPFHETQKALAEMMEKENMMLMLQGQHNDIRHPNSHIGHLNQLHQQYQQMSQNNHFQSQFSQAAMFGTNKVVSGYPAPMQTQVLQNNHRLPANVATISMCSKVDGVTLGPSAGLATVPPRARLPPPGFAIAPNHMNAFGLGIPRAPPSTTGNKILPFIGLGNSSNSSNSGNSSTIPLNLNSMSNNLSISSALNVQQTLNNVNPPPMLFPHSASQTNTATQLNNSYNSRNGTIVHNSTVPKAALGRFNVKDWPDNLRPLLPLINSGSGVSHSPVPLAFSGSNNPTPPTPPPPPAPSHLVTASSSSPSSSSAASSPSSSPSSSSPPPPAPSSSTSSSPSSPPPPSQPPSPPPQLVLSSCTPPPPSLAASPPPTAVPAAPPMPAAPSMPTATLHNLSCNGPVHGAQKSPAKPWSGVGPCSDWTVLDPAIMSSRPHNLFSSSSVGHQHPIIFCNTHSLINQQSQNAQYLHLQNTTHWLRSFASDGCLLYGTNISENVSTSDWTVLSHNSNSVASPPPGFSLRMTSPQTSIENKLVVAASQEIAKIESELCSDYC